MGEMAQRQSIRNLAAGIGNFLQQIGKAIERGADAGLPEQRILQAAQIEPCQTLD